MSDQKYKNIGSVETRTIEECSELIQALCKAKRFGFEGHHPKVPSRKNYDDVIYEINDVRAVCDELEKYIKGRYNVMEETQ